VTENTAPTAAFTATCIDLSCTLDGSSSVDNGPLTYAWDFGDGATDAGVQPVHAFGGVGDHLVTLTVTDAGGLSSTDAHTITIAPNSVPIANFTHSCTGLVCAFDASTSTDSGPLTYAWTFSDGSPAAGIIASHTFATAGSFAVTLTVTDAFGATASAQRTVSVTRPISFVGRSTVSAIATNHVATVPSNVQPGDALLLFFSVGTNATVKQPTGIAGWVPVDTLTGSTASTRVWRKVATAGDAGAQVRINISASSRANITIVAYRGTSTTNPIATFARSLITTNGTARITPKATVSTPTVVVSYWMHRDSTSTALTPPAGVTVRATGTQSGGGRVTVLTADSGANAPVGQYGGLTARAAAASNMATTWTVVLAPA
jgi:PKD repeat protein